MARQCSQHNNNRKLRVTWGGHQATGYLQATEQQLETSEQTGNPTEDNEETWAMRIIRVRFQHYQLSPEVRQLKHSECEYHTEQMNKVISESTHPQHKKFEMYEYKCKYHQQAQRDDIEWQQINLNHSYHGTFYSCKVEDCMTCRKEEDDEEISDSQDMADLQHPEHERLHWSFCSEDDCVIHIEGKKGSEYFSKRKQKKRYLCAIVSVYNSDDNELLTDRNDNNKDLILKYVESINDTDQQEIIMTLSQQFELLQLRIQQFENNNSDWHKVRE
ncbi:hypothetical protein ACO22_07669 [Paracoccidioides brasiliensis]|uniref:Uncharacterized protein n=1 Tax=Paracoccidioides brasiliensis TaxID=121759 RepID=A0A1D2J410_PARBR|nr:hypothetical protein ACO22_07669 [Paracoccidioides brasiliensis]